MSYVDYLVYLSNGISFHYYTKSLKPADFSAACINQGPLLFSAWERLEMYFAIQIKCSLLLPHFNQLKKFKDLLKNYAASNFAKLLSDVPKLLNVSEKRAERNGPKRKIMKRR
jgi:hypothetical protein